LNFIDIFILGLYGIGLIGFGYYCMRKTVNQEDFFVGGRRMGHWHIGLSVVATDVGGGFSIGLGGLGFVMGLAGSWLLFTGLLGAWLSAVWLIPKVYPLGFSHKFTTLPQLFGHYFGARTALLAGVISAIGYLGFSSSQLLAGAKLASAAFAGIDLTTALWIMGLITILYTVLGGMTAVIYTDTLQWIVLLSGMLFIGLPLSFLAVGGWDGIRTGVPPEYFSLANITGATIVKWILTVLPIWFVGMTLYQRIYASRSKESAQKAWFIAGFFEWPVMAFLGVSLGLIARVAAGQGMFESLGYASSVGLDPELGLPLLLRTILPVGLLGVMLAVFFSAILSTADSCLMAATGNVVSDILVPLFGKRTDIFERVRVIQGFTLFLGLLALGIAWQMEQVLSLMLYSYAFMVSGLLVPILAALFWNHKSGKAALPAMLGGGAVSMSLLATGIELPYGIDPTAWGISASLIIYTSVHTYHQLIKVKHEY